MKAYLVAEGVGPSPVRPFTNGSRQTAHSAWDATCKALAAFGGVLLRGYHRMEENIERSRNAPRDAFFAEAVDLCDLEHRIEHYERTGLTRY
jgi:hypothetical protein